MKIYKNNNNESFKFGALSEIHKTAKYTVLIRLSIFILKNYIIRFVSKYSMVKPCNYQ